MSTFPDIFFQCRVSLILRGGGIGKIFFPVPNKERRRRLKYQQKGISGGSILSPSLPLPLFEPIVLKLLYNTQPLQDWVGGGGGVLCTSDIRTLVAR
jgi:hypothetical protein